jgi:hypothetical protein
MIYRVAHPAGEAFLKSLIYQRVLWLARVVLKVEQGIVPGSTLRRLA